MLKDIYLRNRNIGDVDAQLNILFIHKNIQNDVYYKIVKYTNDLKLISIKVRKILYIISYKCYNSFVEVYLKTNTTTNLLAIVLVILVI